jgi:Fe-S-cluster-containing dehydrogenase component
MSRYCIIQDQDRCIGCLSCEIYCRESKQLPEGPSLCQMFMLGRRVVRGLPREAYVYMGCFHCENAACVAACPTGAVKKREADGIVCGLRTVRGMQSLHGGLPVGGAVGPGPGRPSNATLHGSDR